MTMIQTQYHRHATLIPIWNGSHTNSTPNTIPGVPRQFLYKQQCPMLVPSWYLYRGTYYTILPISLCRTEYSSNAYIYLLSLLFPPCVSVWALVLGGLPLRFSSIVCASFFILCLRLFAFFWVFFRLLLLFLFCTTVSLFSFLTYLGCWCVCVVLLVSSTMEWHRVV